MGFSLGGGVGLRTAIQHPDVVERLVLVSTPFKRQGWYPEMTAGMDAMGPEAAGSMMQTPMYEAYQRIAPRVEDWPILVRQVAEVMKIDYDWSAEIPRLPMPVMLVIGDADGLPPSHAVEFFGLLGGGQRDANWDRSGMTHHRLAILPGVTHYDINLVPALSAAVIRSWTAGRGSADPVRVCGRRRPSSRRCAGRRAARRLAARTGTTAGSTSPRTVPAWW